MIRNFGGIWKQAEMKGKKFLCRTAAAFVSARIGHHPALITPQDLDVNTHPGGQNGGLVVVGSYVPKTTKQVQHHLITVFLIS